MGTYRLSKAIDVPITIMVYSHPEGKSGVYGRLYLTPGVTHVLPDDDPAFVNSVKTAITKKRYDEKIENRLKELGVPYEINLCKTCGGRKRFIEYHTVEVEE